MRRGRRWRREEKRGRLGDEEEREGGSRGGMKERRRGGERRSGMRQDLGRAGLVELQSYADIA